MKLCDIAFPHTHTTRHREDPDHTTHHFFQSPASLSLYLQTKLPANDEKHVLTLHYENQK
jgi:hypothetical protein